MHPQKTRVMPAHRRQTVTGVVVNRRLNLPREEYDRLKAIVHACRRPEDRRLADPRFRAHLTGRIGWLESVNPERGARLREKLAQAMEITGEAA